MRSLALAVLALSVATPSVGVAQGTPGYSVADTDIGTLLDDPAAKAVIDRALPGFSANPQVGMARSMTLKGMQQYASGQLTDQKLADIQAGLAKLPKK